MVKNLLLLFGLISLMLSCRSSQSVSDFDTQSNAKFSLYDLMDESKESGKAILIDVYTDWCVPCQVMDEYVFVDNSVQQMLSEDFIFRKLDGESQQGRDLIYLFKVKSFPALLFIDHRGRIVHQHEGGLSLSEFQSLGTQISADYQQ